MNFTTLSKEFPPVITAGKGSYAGYPLYSEGHEAGFIQNYALNTQFNLSNGDTRPVPTNDWWTHLLFNDTNTSLWIYPQVLQTINEGFRLFYPRTFNKTGTNIELGAFVMITGDD